MLRREMCYTNKTDQIIIDYNIVGEKRSVDHGTNRFMIWSNVTIYTAVPEYLQFPKCFVKNHLKMKIMLNVNC